MVWAVVARYIGLRRLKYIVFTLCVNQNGYLKYTSDIGLYINETRVTNL